CGDLSKRVLFPRTAKACGVDSTRAAALSDGVSRLATLIGAPVAGVLIAVAGASGVLLIDAASFLAGAALVAGLVPRLASTVDGQPREPYVTAIRGGLDFLRRDRFLAAMLLVFFATNLFDAAYGSVLIPVWAGRIGQPVALGLVSGCFALGAVLGNVVFTALASRVPRYAVFTLGFLVGGAPRYVAAAVADQTWIVFAVSFVAGLGMAAVNPITGALFYERVPEHLMARVQGIATALGWAGIPLGALLGGLAAQGLGVGAALLAFGAAYLLVTLSPLIWPSWRQLDRPHPNDKDSPVPMRSVDAN
ncbi:MFS transporter, partial [Allorhizocola rhizosphaerae]|uniref:MFS transporter n=1 Tax=Allorhizocola rhizosphaerae TaxID=1872709 RepID=UPI0013C34A8A